MLQAPLDTQQHHDHGPLHGELPHGRADALRWGNRTDSTCRTGRGECLTPVPSSTAGIPHLRECPAYCECELYREVALEGDEVLILGQIRCLAVHTDVIGLGPGEMYSRLAPGFFFLEPELRELWL